MKVNSLRSFSFSVNKTPLNIPASSANNPSISNQEQLNNPEFSNVSKNYFKALNGIAFKGINAHEAYGIIQIHSNILQQLAVARRSYKGLSEAGKLFYPKNTSINQAVEESCSELLRNAQEIIDVRNYEHIQLSFKELTKLSEKVSFLDEQITNKIFDFAEKNMQLEDRGFFTRNEARACFINTAIYSGRRLGDALNHIKNAFEEITGIYCGEASSTDLRTCIGFLPHLAEKAAQKNPDELKNILDYAISTYDRAGFSDRIFIAQAVGKVGTAQAGRPFENSKEMNEIVNFLFENKGYLNSIPDLETIAKSTKDEQLAEKIKGGLAEYNISKGIELLFKRN